MLKEERVFVLGLKAGQVQEVKQLDVGGSVHKIEEKDMPYGVGTYGSKKGRPPKKSTKKIKKKMKKKK
jgi:hypothetical protein